MAPIVFDFVHLILLGPSEHSHKYMVEFHEPHMSPTEFATTHGLHYGGAHGAHPTVHRFYVRVKLLI